ncbi:MAG TPA: RDD family protein [Thermoleophilaceae bacterium]|nr:RDD family protein [Thermoleophilaceae bacterium]
MSRSPVVLRPGSGTETPLADWWSRFGAWLVDTLILMVLAVVLFFAIWAASGDARSAGIAAAIAWGATEYLVRGLVYAPLLMRRSGAHNGQTLGKQLTGIRVVRAEGGEIGYARAVRREWVARTLLIQVGGVLLTAGIVTFLDYFEPLLDKRRRALHDMVARTLVHRAEAAAQPRPGP